MGSLLNAYAPGAIDTDIGALSLTTSNLTKSDSEFGLVRYLDKVSTGRKVGELYKAVSNLHLVSKVLPTSCMACPYERKDIGGVRRQSRRSGQPRILPSIEGSALHYR